MLNFVTLNHVEFNIFVLYGITYVLFRSEGYVLLVVTHVTLLSSLIRRF